MFGQYDLEKLDSSLFTWQRWRAGSIIDVGVPAMRDYLLDGFHENIRKYAIGYCRGESLLCRPKNEHKAVMFLVQDNMFWTHFRNEAFDKIFKRRSL